MVAVVTLGTLTVISIIISALVISTLLVIDIICIALAFVVIVVARILFIVIRVVAIVILFISAVGRGWCDTCNRRSTRYQLCNSRSDHRLHCLLQILCHTALS